MPVQDFTTYAETDPNSRITVTATKVTGASLDQVEIAHVSKDFGAGYFAGDFEHNFEIKLTGTTGSSAILVATVADTLGTENTLDVAGSGIALFSRFGATSFLREYDSGAINASVVEFTFVTDTLYYCTLIRDESIGSFGQYSLEIYSDSARTTLLETLTVNQNTSKKDLRYAYGLQSREEGTAGKAWSGFIENLEFIATAGDMFFGINI